MVGNPTVNQSAPQSPDSALIGYIAIFAGLPFLAWIVFGAGYKIFLKPFVRAWHINRIRNRRDLREAANRNP